MGEIEQYLEGHHAKSVEEHRLSVHKSLND